MALMNIRAVCIERMSCRGVFRRRSGRGRHGCAGGNQDGQAIDDGVAAVTPGAIDCLREQQQWRVADRADEHLQMGRGELHVLRLLELRKQDPRG